MRSKTTPKKRSLIERVKEASVVLGAIGAIITLGTATVGGLWYFKPEWRPWQSQQIGLEGKVVSEKTSLEQYLTHVGIDPKKVEEQPITRSPGGTFSAKATASSHGNTARNFSRTYLRSTGRMLTAVIRITGRARGDYFLNWRMKNTTNDDVVYDSKSDFRSDLNKEYSRNIKLEPSIDQLAVRIWVPTQNADGTDLAGEFQAIVDVFDVKGSLIYNFPSEKFKIP